MRKERRQYLQIANKAREEILTATTTEERLLLLLLQLGALYACLNTYSRKED